MPRGALTPEQIQAAEDAGVPPDAPQYRPGVTADEVRRLAWNKTSGCYPLKYTLGDLDVPQEVHDWLGDLWQGHCERGLVLSGPPGVGKSTLLKAILHEVIELAPRANLGWTREEIPRCPVLFLPMSQFITDLGRRMSLEGRKQYDEEYDELDDRLAGIMLATTRTRAHVRFLGLDDIGTEYSAGTDWVPSQLNMLLRQRGHLGGITLATSNIAMSKMGELYGPAVGSYCYEAFTEVIIGGKDRRR